MAFKIGEVAKMLELRPSILRYWEGEFEELKPPKSSSNQRAYRIQDVKAAFVIKKLLYKDRFSIEGAKAILRKEKFKKNFLFKENREDEKGWRDKSQSSIRDHLMNEAFDEEKEEKEGKEEKEEKMESSFISEDSLALFEVEKKEDELGEKKENQGTSEGLSQKGDLSQNSKILKKSSDSSSSSQVGVHSLGVFYNQKEFSKEETLQEEALHREKEKKQPDPAFEETHQKVQKESRQGLKEEDFKFLRGRMLEIKESVSQLKKLLNKEDFFN